MSYIQNIRALCEARNMPIGKLEMLCGFPQGTLARWARIVPQIDKFEKVADVLECSIDELCGRMYYVEQAEKRSDAALEDMLRFQAELNAQHPADDLTEEERSLVRAFRKMSDAKKLQLLFSLVKLSEDPQ